MFSPDNDFKTPSVIAMEKWLDAPAGNHGFLEMKGNNLVFEDGEPIKFWGVNICSDQPFVANDKADKYVNMLAFMGVNGVRFHKFTWEATDSKYSTVPDSLKFLKMDYFQYKLKERGIYYGWSHIYGHKVKPKDSSRLLSYREIANLSYPWKHLNGSSSSLVNFANDLQDLNIELTVNMLNRVSPYSGLRYADDPALSFIEFQNEDNIFWAAMEAALKQAPTYRALLCKQFSEWLKDKYDTDEYLKIAWGSNLPEGESISKMNVYPTPNHGVFGFEYNRALKDDSEIPNDVLDKMRFLYDTQLKFYKRFEKAIRETGYKGIIVGSNWQAGSGISHLYNLHADYSVGMVDRHNYFGGGKGGHVLDTGKVKSKTMVSLPGSGLLSTGMQQVENRPFAISEWMSLIPNEYTAESSPIIATYGMGLQGWDASFAFAVDEAHYTNTLQSKHGVYNVTSPLQMALYPALSSMIYRGDITEAPSVTERNVHIPSLMSGKLGFSEQIEQRYDDKYFSGSVPPEALAFGKIPIVFTEEYEETKDLSVEQLQVYGNKAITSITDELKWDYSGKGYITINTKGTKGIIGFTKGKEFDLEGWKLSTENDFVVIYLTSLDKFNGMDQSRKILITAIARARNKGMAYIQDGTYLVKKGTAPIELEPVNFELSSPRNTIASLQPLDHMGRLTGEKILLKKNKIRINGNRYKTMYYLLEF
ncbi:beta-galactosidase [Maribacter sp. X9]|uniref:beta-galactosidase n=1 Tax=Maribacter sp. X9 TaxID=3402159 RepID=UPI003AF3EEC0